MERHAEAHGLVLKELGAAGVRLHGRRRPGEALAAAGERGHRTAVEAVGAALRVRGRRAAAQRRAWRRPEAALPPPPPPPPPPPLLLLLRLAATAASAARHAAELKRQPRLEQKRRRCAMRLLPK